MGLIANDDASCGALYENPEDPDDIFDEKYHSNQMEVHKKEKLTLTASLSQLTNHLLITLRQVMMNASK